MMQRTNKRGQSRPTDVIRSSYGAAHDTISYTTFREIAPWIDVKVRITTLYYISTTTSILSEH